MEDQKKLAGAMSEMITELLRLAEKNIKKSDFFYRLSAAIVYASVAEFIGDTIIFTLNYKINKIASKSLSKNTGLSKTLSKNTNLESTIRKLEFYTFKDKHELILHLTKIKDARNRLFHNLITAPLKNIHPDKEIIDIQKYTQAFIKFWLDKEYLRDVNS